MASNRRRPAEAVGGEPAQRAGRILIIEDEQDVAELMRYNLAKEGYGVRLVSNGLDGFQQARESRPDMILLARNRDRSWRRLPLPGPGQERLVTDL